MISKNQIKYIQSLHLKKNREKEAVFIVEGIKLVTEFLQSKTYKLKAVFAVEEFNKNYGNLAEATGAELVSVTEEELKKISLLTTPNQVLALVAVNDVQFNPHSLHEGVSLFLDDIRDPGNLGTIIRIADWFGVTQVICSKGCTELYNPKTLQATMGAVLRVPVVYMDFEALLPYCKTIPIYGAVLNGENIYQSDLKKGLIIIGNEANGVSREVMKHITHPLTIPAAQANGSESLNAANAFAIICGEFHRQLNFK